MKIKISPLHVLFDTRNRDLCDQPHLNLYMMGNGEEYVGSQRGMNSIGRENPSWIDRPIITKPLPRLQQYY